MDKMTEQELIGQLRQPDIEQAVRYLYGRYFDAMIAHVSANGGTADDGADIFQEALLVVINKVKTGAFRGDSAVGTFLTAVARNLWLHECRTRERRKKREKDFVGVGQTEDPGIYGGFGKDHSAALEQLMRQVGDVCRRLLTGFYYEDKSMRELLVEFDYENEQVLRNKKSKCMKKLKELLQGDQAIFRELQSTSIYE